MSLTMVQQGRCPWLPSSEAHNLVTLLHYDIPLAGLFEQSGRIHAFACLRGESGEAGLWIYGDVTSLEAAARLQATEFESAAAVVDAVKLAVSASPIVLALSSQETILLHADFGAGTAVPAAVRGFEQQLDSLVRQQRTMAERQQERANFVLEHADEIRELLSA